MKIINLKLERFGDRVEFSGNPSKYDVSVTLKNVQLEDEGIYNCYITNPPDRHRGHGKIYLQVLLEGKSDWAAVRHSPFSTAYLRALQGGCDSHLIFRCLPWKTDTRLPSRGNKSVTIKTLIMPIVWMRKLRFKSIHFLR